MKIRRKLKRVPWWVRNTLVFCVAELVAVIIYNPIAAYAMAHRQSTAPGGEVLLVLLAGFIAVFAADTARQGRKTKLRKEK